MPFECAGIEPSAVASHQGSPHVVKVCPTDYAEFHKRIGIEALGQRLCQELPELYAWFQRNLDEGPKHRLRCRDDVRSSKEPHSIDKPDQALLFAT